MNVLLSPQPSFFPHQHDPIRRSPSRSLSPFPNNMSANRKRKADDDGDEMSVSPLSSPAIQNRQLAPRPTKKVRSQDITGRPLSLPRLLETLDAASLRSVLQKICERQPEIGEEVVKSAPRPTIQSALQVLQDYQDRLRAAFPYGESSSDYTYYRVKAPLVALVDALSDFTPQYLPPVETQTNVSLQYLDAATKVIHDLPEWESQSYRHHKDNAYDEISKAWALVISEAAKRGGGFALHSGGWDQTITKHNQQSGGRLEAAMLALAANANWAGASNAGQPAAAPAEQSSILNDLLNGNFGSPVRVGPW